MTRDTSALSKYSIGRRNNNWDLENSGQEEVSRLKDMVEDVGQAIQRRLHYEEA